MIILRPFICYARIRLNYHVKLRAGYCIATVSAAMNYYVSAITITIINVRKLTSLNLVLRTMDHNYDA